MSVPKLDQQTETTMKQFREFLLSYNKLSEMCFTDCVHDFTTRKVLDSEVTGHSPVPMVNLTMRFRFTTRKGYSHFHRLPDVKTKVDPFDDFSKTKLYNELHGQIPEDHTAHISEVPRDSDATERIRKSPLIDSIAPQVPPDTLG